MAWTWRLENSAGETTTSAISADNAFPSRADAESWIGEVWEELLDEGITQVTLFEEGREVYGPMSLQSE